MKNLKVVKLSRATQVREIAQDLLQNAEHYRHAFIIMEDVEGIFYHSHTATESVRLIGMAQVGIEFLLRGFE